MRPAAAPADGQGRLGPVGEETDHHAASPAQQGSIWGRINAKFGLDLQADASKRPDGGFSSRPDSASMTPLVGHSEVPKAASHWNGWSSMLPSWKPLNEGKGGPGTSHGNGPPPLDDLPPGEPLRPTASSHNGSRTNSVSPEVSSRPSSSGSSKPLIPNHQIKSISMPQAIHMSAMPPQHSPSMAVPSPPAQMYVSPTKVAPKSAMGLKSNLGGNNAGGGDMGGTGGAPPPKAPNPNAPQYRILMPDLDTSTLDNTVHAVVWRVGRYFGFQAFNSTPRTQNQASKEYVPATIMCASDHLTALLVKNAYLRREKQDDHTNERFAKALTELHAVIFESYETQWTKQMGLSCRPQAMQDMLYEYTFSSSRVINGLLNELALYFLIYTEAANLRHCPELMWFLFWAMNHSYIMLDLWQRDPPQVIPAAREHRVKIRNEYQAVIEEVQDALRLFPKLIRPEDTSRMTAITARLAMTKAPPAEHPMLAEMVAFGDGGFFCDRIITPIFLVMAYEVDHMSNLGVEVAHRLGYDDFNESFCLQRIVHTALAELRVTESHVVRGLVNDSYQAITNLGYHTAGYVDTKFDATVASSFWRRHFVKTYYERRSWAGPIRAFYRIYSFHAILYTFLQTQAFVGWDWRKISGCIITHAWCAAFERFCNWHMTRHVKDPLQTSLAKSFDEKAMKMYVVRNRMEDNYRTAHEQATDALLPKDGNFMTPTANMRHRKVIDIEGAPLWGVFGFLEWIVLAIIATGWFVLQWLHTPLQAWTYDWWPMFAIVYTGVFGLHAIITTRDGYCISLTQALHLPDFMRASSVRGEPTCWLHGTMHMKWKLFFLNALFWVICLSSKAAFDYYVICAPSVEPIQLIFTRKWLGCNDRYYAWSNGHVRCIGGDWLLVAVRMVPFVLVTFMDTALFYQCTVTLFGVTRGMFALDLGVLSSWSDVVREFYKAPSNWWYKCMSDIGQINQTSAMKHFLFKASGEEGGDGAMVYDGKMFKQAALSPEEIRAGRKVKTYGNDAKGGANAGKGSAAAVSAGGGGGAAAGAGGGKAPDSDNRWLNLIGRVTAEAKKGQRSSFTPSALTVAFERKRPPGAAPAGGGKAVGFARGLGEGTEDSVLTRFFAGMAGGRAGEANKDAGEGEAESSHMHRGPGATSEAMEDSTSTASSSGSDGDNLVQRWGPGPVAEAPENFIRQAAGLSAASPADVLSIDAGRPGVQTPPRHGRRSHFGDEESIKASSLSPAAAAGAAAAATTAAASVGGAPLHGRRSNYGGSERDASPPETAGASSGGYVAPHQALSNLRPRPNPGTSPLGGVGSNSGRQQSANGAPSGAAAGSGGESAASAAAAASFVLPKFGASRSLAQSAESSTGSAAGGSAPPLGASRLASVTRRSDEQSNSFSDASVNQRSSAQPRSAMSRMNNSNTSAPSLPGGYQDSSSHGGDLSTLRTLQPAEGSNGPKIVEEFSDDESDASPTVFAGGPFRPMKPGGGGGAAGGGAAVENSGVSSMLAARFTDALHKSLTAAQRNLQQGPNSGQASMTLSDVNDPIGGDQSRQGSALFHGGLLPRFQGVQRTAGSTLFAPVSHDVADEWAAIQPLGPDRTTRSRVKFGDDEVRSIPAARSSGAAPQQSAASATEQDWGGMMAGLKSWRNKKDATPHVQQLDEQARSNAALTTLRTATQAYDAVLDPATGERTGSATARRTGSVTGSTGGIMGGLVQKSGGSKTGILAGKAGGGGGANGGAAGWHRSVSQKHDSSIKKRRQSMFMIDSAASEEPVVEEIDEVHYQMMMWQAFASAWDEIVDDLRGVDYINHAEVKVLKFVHLDLGSHSYGLRPILLPTFFYAGKVRKIVDTGEVGTAEVMVLNELRTLCLWLGCQVGIISGKHAHVISSVSFHGRSINVKHSLLRKKFFSSACKLAELLDDMCSRQEVPFDMTDLGEALHLVLAGLEGECFAVMKKNAGPEDEDAALCKVLLEVINHLRSELLRDLHGLKLAMKGALNTSATADWKELHRVVQIIRKMLTVTVVEATPESEEACRILSFFVNSLNHPHLDQAHRMDYMASHSILTPLYEEDVLYAYHAGHVAKEMGLKRRAMTDLVTPNDDDISLMAYLKSTFPQEWANFRERMKGLCPEVVIDDLTELDFGKGHLMEEFRLELQMWASLRGQLLARTVNGMMCYERALRTLCRLEYPVPPDMSQTEYKHWVDRLVSYKFEYVVSPQAYGACRDSTNARLRWLARSMDILMVRFPSLKVAFLDAGETSDGPTQYSVCSRGRDQDDPNQLCGLDEEQVYELYRVRLPHNPYSSRGVILGEGKPENQNHATIFAFGESLQAIDMNQDNCLAEALKMRNLLSELQPSSPGQFNLFANDDHEFVIQPSATASELRAVIRFRQKRCMSSGLVGFREHIFSNKTGALGQFAAATEYAFGTIQQRTMTFPGRVRLHYGHPDVFNKMFTISRGGISRATRQLHLTEDVFSGCNHTLRGARLRYKEYISCGKGRDMGFDSINGFNLKISGGGGEWAISRETYRVSCRFDFFRLNFLYFSGVGFYVNSYLVHLCIWLNIYALVVFALTNSMAIGDSGIAMTYNTAQILQLGMLSLIPYIGQLMLEMGIVRAAALVLSQICTGSLLFYVFLQQTIAMSFIADMMYGTGKYVGTGRGFNLAGLDFVKCFSLYCRTHIYYGFELLGMLTVLYIVAGYNEVVVDYALITWSSWMAAATMVFAPLWFNPFTFDMNRIRNNWTAWHNWMSGDVDQGTGSNWYIWNSILLEKMRNDSSNVTDNWVNMIYTVLMSTPYAILALAATSRLDISLDAQYVGHNTVLGNPYIILMMASLTLVFTCIVAFYFKGHFTDTANKKGWRLFTWGATLLVVALLAVFLFVAKRWYYGNGFATLALIMYANFNILIMFHRIVLTCAPRNNMARAFVDTLYYTFDYTVGLLLFMVMAVLSFIVVVGFLQMQLLFDDSFANVVMVNKLSRQLKDTKAFAPALTKAEKRIGAVSRPVSAQSSAETTITQLTAVASTVHSYGKSEHKYM